MSAVPWKEASSLIVMARWAMTQRIGNQIGKSSLVTSRVVSKEQPKNLFHNNDYRVLMVKRSGLSSFMASAYVFPGGRVETPDYNVRWWSVFEKLGFTQNDLRATFVNGGVPRPPMIMDPVTLKNEDTIGSDFLPADIALRISAIRETFEETGILLLTANRDKLESPYSDLDNISINLSEWREKVREDANAFIDMCLEANLCPDLWSLYEWSNWLTPISVGHKRFDTMFYVCCLEKQPNVILDNSEITTLKWCTPMEMLNDHSQEKVFLAPPQVYELSRIQNLSNFASVKEFVQKRQQYGTDRWLPVLATYKDGAISLLPGDETYPSEPDIIGRKPVPDYPQTLADMRTKVVNMNRIELRGSTCTPLCNVKLNCGQLSPVDYSTIQGSLQSML